MAELVSFEDAARELEVGTEEVTRLVASGTLQTGEEGGLLKIDRESLDAYKSSREEAPLRLTEVEPGPAVLPSIGLAAEEAAEAAEVEGEPVEAAAEAGGDTTESIFGDEGFELETFTETAREGVRAGEELAELEEAGEELGAEEMAELTAEAGAPVGRRAVRARPVTSPVVTVMLVVTLILLLFAGLVIFNFGLQAPQVIIEPISSWLVNLAQ